MSDTKIEWATKVWNPVTGCIKVSDGCKFCYAERQWPRLEGNKKTLYHGREFTDVQCHEHLLQEPFKWKKPERIFVNSMSDLFHEDVPHFFIDQMFAVMALNPHHTFIVLTKRPERMLCWIKKEWDCEELDIEGADSAQAVQFQITDIANNLDSEGFNFSQRQKEIVGWEFGEEMQWPLPNVWLGVSVEDQQTADERIPLLLDTPAAQRIISYEPALGPVNFEKFLVPPSEPVLSGAEGKGAEGASSLNWIIAGGESGPNARPSHPNWFRNVRDQCRQYNIPFFFKQWGEWVAGSQLTVEKRELLADTLSFDKFHKFNDCNDSGNMMVRVGKKAAGHLLDGKEYFQLPEVG